MSLSSNLIKNPGLRVLPPGVERYVIQGGGIHVFEINSDVGTSEKFGSA